MMIRKLRIQRAWSQEQLAEFSGLSIRTVQRVEQGQVASLETLKSLAAVFEVSVTDLQPEPTMQTDTPSTQTPHVNPSIEERQAIYHVHQVKRFYYKLARYVVVIAFLAAINALTSPHYWWVLWVAAIWGLVLALCALKVFWKLEVLGPDWEKREVEKRLGRKL
jgi:transcriptional regulator with XRE-family HTH domain